MSNTLLLSHSVVSTCSEIVYCNFLKDDTYARYALLNTHTQARVLACPQIIAHRPACVNKLLEDVLIVTCGAELPGGRSHHIIFLLANPTSFTKILTSRLELRRGLIHVDY